MNRRLPYAPVEGWLTVALVTLMCLTLAWSIDDAVPVLGQGAWTDFLMYAALGGVAAGFIGAKARWRRWTSHLVGAMFAALIVPLLVGLVLLEEGRSLGTLYRASADAASGAFVDLGDRPAAHDRAVRPSPPDHRPARLGVIDVRELCRVRAPSADQRRPPHRADAGDRHVADDQG